MCLKEIQYNSCITHLIYWANFGQFKLFQIKFIFSAVVFRDYKITQIQI